MQLPHKAQGNRSNQPGLAAILSPGFGIGKGSRHRDCTGFAMDLEADPVPELNCFKRRATKPEKRTGVSFKAAPSSQRDYHFNWGRWVRKVGKG